MSVNKFNYVFLPFAMSRRDWGAVMNIKDSQVNSEVNASHEWNSQVISEIERASYETRSRLSEQTRSSGIHGGPHLPSRMVTVAHGRRVKMRNRFVHCWMPWMNGCKSLIYSHIGGMLHKKLRIQCENLFSLWQSDSMRGCVPWFVRPSVTQDFGQREICSICDYDPLQLSLRLYL